MVEDRVRTKEQNYVPLHEKGNPKGVHSRGREFFFSGMLIKVEQIPNLFIEDARHKIENSYSFVVLLLQKDCRKRHPVFTD